MTRIWIQHVTRIWIQHVIRFEYNMWWGFKYNMWRGFKYYMWRGLIWYREGRFRDRSGHQSVPTKDAYELKETKDTQGINYGGSSNDNMASDFSTPQSHAINDGSSVISNSVSDWWRFRISTEGVTIYYNWLCIRVCALYK